MRKMTSQWGHKGVPCPAQDTGIAEGQHTQKDICALRTPEVACSQESGKREGKTIPTPTGPGKASSL